VNPLHVYLTLFLLLFFIEGTGMPGIPYEPAFLAAGFLIENGQMDFWGAVLVGILGNLLGNLAGYWLGAHPGKGLFMRILRRSGGEEALLKARHWLDRYGAPLVVLARWFSPIRTPTILAAGLAGMDFRAYLFYSALGAFTWTWAWQYIYCRGTHYLYRWWRLYRSYSTWWTDLLLILVGLLLTAISLYYCYLCWEGKKEKKCN